MLRDGHFLREDPIYIGSKFSPWSKRIDYTPEELLWQRFLLLRDQAPPAAPSAAGWLVAMIGKALR